MLSLTDVLNILSEHHLVEDLSTLHSHEGVVHLGLAERLEGLDIICAHVGSVESRTGRGSLWRDGRSCALFSLRGLCDISLLFAGSLNACLRSVRRDGCWSRCGGKAAGAWEGLERPPRRLRSHHGCKVIEQKLGYQLGMRESMGVCVCESRRGSEASERKTQDSLDSCMK